MNVAANFFKKESRSPRGFLPRPLLRAGESVAPPPLPQKNSGGAYHFRFRFLDLCIMFGKIISKACPVGSRSDSFGVCEGFKSGGGHSGVFRPASVLNSIKTPDSIWDFDFRSHASESAFYLISGHWQQVLNRFFLGNY
ncbi:MAG: hypothetical protein A3D44_02945 [Candidatus Staskawiczbacteria bacterium RIFCSPHIGHO2_02_FULL_42_22]|uniref:Uncharacterized protein n=1 Tax=Candidatus Staskawiczbacteria bacterium RIFCSPHIGHO2_02_FULL_42_22 TaxID=1802207 RepID=A0A1G2HZK9_9BACT|nr:MAG: hypothetical protein A3D44_02945 [Candidatus Staskawiczbacteria bacterium RIFCSPHIGHO2_02_FULL_42_22]